MPLGHLREPFHNPDWLFEIKWDGFVALLYSEKDSLRLVSLTSAVTQNRPMMVT